MENNKFKICVSSTGESLDLEIDSHFGRCSFFAIVEIEDGKMISSEFIKNEAAERGHGAGTTAADFVAGLGVKTIISGDFGPKANDVLSQLGVEMVRDRGTINEVINKYLSK